MSSVRDAPLVSARAAGIPKPIYSNPPAPELFSLAEALTWMGVALCCVWAAYITHELSETAEAIILPFVVAAESAEPPRAVASAAVSSEVVVNRHGFPRGGSTSCRTSSSGGAHFRAK